MEKLLWMTAQNQKLNLISAKSVAFHCQIQATLKHTLRSTVVKGQIIATSVNIHQLGQTILKHTLGFTLERSQTNAISVNIQLQIEAI